MVVRGGQEARRGRHALAHITVLSLAELSLAELSLAELSLAGAGRSWAFDAPGEAFKLAAEAYRINSLTCSIR